MAKQQNQIDVVADFAYTSENPRYNQGYKTWRRINKKPYMYRFAGHPDEIAYVAGGAATQPSAPMAERKALSHVSEILGTVLLIFLVAELLGGTLLVGLLHLIGLDIRLDFLSLSMRGNQWAVAAVRALTIMLKYLIPLLVLVRYCHIPRQVAMPISVGGLPETIGAVGAAMMTVGVNSLIAQGKDVSRAQQIFTYKDAAAVFAYAIFDILAASLLAELLLRGAIFPLLRQFGDPFAVVITALIAFLFPNDLPGQINELLIGLAAGYLLLRSGSIAKCVLLRVVCTALNYARLILVYANHSVPLWQFALLMLSTGALATATFFQLRKEHILLQNTRTQLRDGQKLFTLMQSVTMLPWVCVSVLLMLLKLFF